MVSIDSWWDGLIRDRFEAVLDLVINAIADDYESVETILKSINEWSEGIGPEDWPARKAIPVSRPEVIRALRELTLHGFAQAYRVDVTGQRLMQTAFRESEINELWFYVTPKGRTAIERLFERGSSKP